MIKKKPKCDFEIFLKFSFSAPQLKKSNKKPLTIIDKYTYRLVEVVTKTELDPRTIKNANK